MQLRCPVCHHPLIKNDRVFVCEHNHSFDISKSGHVNLSRASSKGHGDEKDMVLARTSFLNTNSYDFMRQRLCQLIESLQPESLIDLGCGEGWYTSQFPCAQKYGFDLSKDAIQYAAKHDKTTQYVIASTKHLPLDNHDCDLAVICFSPVFADELKRVLKEDGHLIVVSPAPRHLYELKEVLYETPYENPEDTQIPEGFRIIAQERITQSFTIDQKHIMDLFMMTPYYHHTRKDAVDRLASIDSLTLTASFNIHIYQAD